MIQELYEMGYELVEDFGYDEAVYSIEEDYGWEDVNHWSEADVEVEEIVIDHEARQIIVRLYDED